MNLGICVIIKLNWYYISTTNEQTPVRILTGVFHFKARL